MVGLVRNPIVVKMGQNMDRDSIGTSLTDDQASVLDISEESNLINNRGSMALQDLDSGAIAYYTAKGFDVPGMEHGFQPTPRPPGGSGISRTPRPALRLVIK